MNKLITLIIVAFITGCAPDPDSQNDIYGYHHTSVTAMGIMYRVDPGGIELDPEQLDYYFASVMDCTGETIDPHSLLIISTAEDVHPHATYAVEGWAWGVTDTTPGRIAINSTQMENGVQYVLAHELVHIFVNSDEHDDPRFRTCGAIIY